MVTKVIFSCSLLAALAALVCSQTFVRNITSPGFPKPYTTLTSTFTEIDLPSSDQVAFVIRYLYLNGQDSLGFATGEREDKSCDNSLHVVYKGSSAKYGRTLLGHSASDYKGRACVAAYYKSALASDNTTVNMYHIDVFGYIKCPSVKSPQNLTEPNFFISSPDYPSQYETGLDCKWWVRPVSHTSQRIRVQIETLKLASKHFLELYPVAGGPVNATNGTYLSDSNSMSIRFSSTGSSSKSSGFTLNYKLVGCKATEIWTRDHGSIANPRDFYDAGAVVHHQCNAGWKFVSGLSHESVVCDGAQWKWLEQTAQSACMRVVCDALPELENGQVSLTDGANAGSVANFSCNTGFQLVGDQTISCGEDGSWSGSEVLPQCLNSSEIACGQLIAPAEGHWQCITPTSTLMQRLAQKAQNLQPCTTHESVQKLVCHEGYYVDGPTKTDVTMCNFTEWTNLPLHCALHCCSNLSAIAVEAHLDYYSDGICYQNSFQFFCKTGYHLVGQASRLCGSEGTWLPTEQVPSCRVAECGAPPTPNAETTLVSFNGTNYNSEAYYSCLDAQKYDLVGPATLTCLAEEKWSSETAPTCVKKQCSLLQIHELVPGAAVQPLSPQYYVDDNVTLTCANSSTTASCSPTGWLHVNIIGPCSSSIRYLGNIRSPGYPKPYELEPQSVVQTVQALYNERIIYVVHDASMNLRDTLTISTVSPAYTVGTWKAHETQCSTEWVKQYEGQSEQASASDVVFTPSHWSCSTFTVAQKPQPGATLQRGFYIDVYAIQSCPAAQDGYTITESAFYIASPNFPYVFPTGSTCSWLVAPSACFSGQRLMLNIEYIKTKQSEDGSCAHQLSVGPVNGKMKAVCGYLENIVLLSDGCSASVYFDAQASNVEADNGFFMSYHVTGCASKDLPTKQNANLLNPATYYQSAFTATFQCEAGYYFKSGAQLEYALCDDSGIWKPIGADTACVPHKCDTKLSVVNGVANVVGDGSYGTLINVTCEAGFKLVGEALLMCTESGAWSAPVPSCVSDTDGRCSDPSILHGRLLCQVTNTNTNQLSHMCHLQCDSGYYANYNGNVTCSHGVLSPADLSCVAVRCGNISQNDENLAWAPSEDTVGSAVEFHCKAGYYLDGPDTAVCSSEGRWTYLQPGEAKCVAMVCDAPPHAVRLEVLYYEQPTYKSEALYSCARAYELVGTNRLVCGAEGNWVGTMPYCVPKTCSISEILAVVSEPDAVVWPSEAAAVAVSQLANVTCGGMTTQAVCTENGWNLDGLYAAGCLIPPSPTPDSLQGLSNVTFDYLTLVNLTEAFVTAKTFSASNKNSRIVFVTRYANLKEGDTLSYHMGASSAPAGASTSTASTSVSAMADEQWRCSASAVQLLRTYSGGFSRELDIVYATDTACAQLKLQPRDDSPSSKSIPLGFSVQAFEIQSCPSMLQPTTLTESQFALVSPHYPRSYSAFESCFWNIKPRQCGSGQALQILVVYADITWPHELRFTLGNTSEAIVSGSVQNSQFVMEGCDVNVHFDASVNAEPGKGFELTYKVIGCDVSAIPITNLSHIVNPQNFYPPGYVVELQCVLGMQFESGELLGAVACAVDNTWQPAGTLSPCIPVFCDTLPHITNGESNPPSPVVNATYSTIVTYACGDDYLLVGDRILTCHADGKWSGAPPVCALPSEVIDCNEPFAMHAHFTCASRSRDSLCVTHDAQQLATCELGYELSSSGSSSAAYITCSNATWVPEPESVCKRKCCANISQLAANVSSPASIDVLTGQCYQDTVEFSCAIGYNISGPAQAVCTADASWSAHVPSCHIVQCLESLPPKDGVLHATMSGSSFGSCMSYYCDSGYQLNGESSRLCQADGTWSGSEPECLPNECASQDLKMLVAGLTILDEVPVYYFGDSASVSCGGVDSVNVTCGAQGWDTEALYSAGCLTTPPVPTTMPLTSTTLRTVTTWKPSLFEVPRYVTNVTSTNFPDYYPSPSAAAAATVSNGGLADERVVFFVKVANLRAGDSLQLFSKAAASASACLDSKALKQYTGTVNAGENEYGSSDGGRESDYIVTSTSSACYSFDSASEQSKNEARPIGFYMDVFSLADCPSEESKYTLKASSFALASPNYPSAYPIKKRCRWNIAPACSSQRLQFQFDVFDVACGHYVHIDDSNTSDSFCGSNKPPSVILTQSCIASVLFDTSAPSNPASGFRVSYSVIGCGEDQLPTREHASFSTLDFYDAGVQVNYSCTVGMHFVSGKPVERVRCSATYQWQLVDEPTACVSVTCQTLAAPENGRVTVVSYEYKGEALFSCNEAFELVGSSLLTCSENGSWSSTPPYCRSIVYEPCFAPIFANSELACMANCSTVNGSYVHGAMLDAACKLGFESQSFSRTLLCSNGTWTPDVSDCTRICCSPYNLVGNEQSPQRLQPSTVVPGSCFNDTVLFSCPEAYKLVGPTQAVCGADKKWTPAGVSYCEPVRCEALPQTPQLQVSSMCEIVTYGCSVLFSCPSGYNLVGQQLGACDERGKWEYVPKCNVNTCALGDLEAQLPLGAKLDMPGGSVANIEYGKTVSVSCLSKTVEVKCGAQSWESGTLCSLVCVPNYCSTEQITEVAATVGASVSFPNNVGSTVQEGYSVALHCSSYEVDTAICESVTWETKPLEEIRRNCEKLSTPSSMTPNPTSIGSTATRSSSSTSQSAAPNSTSQNEPGITEEGIASIDIAVVIALAVVCGILAVALILLLLYIFTAKSMFSLKRYAANSLENSFFQQMQTYDTGEVEQAEKADVTATSNGYEKFESIAEPEDVTPVYSHKIGGKISTVTVETQVNC